LFVFSRRNEWKVFMVELETN